MKNFNGKFIEIDGIDIPILLESGLDIDFAKNTLSKCDLKKINNGNLLMINKNSMYIMYKTKLVNVIDEQNDTLYDKEGNQITLTYENIL